MMQRRIRAKADLEARNTAAGVVRREQRGAAMRAPASAAAWGSAGFGRFPGCSTNGGDFAVNSLYFTAGKIIG
jgi:hypothetical protein